MNMPHILRISGVLLILALLIELLTLLWDKPLSFLLFAFVGGVLFVAGVLIYLYSLVSIRE